MGLGGMGRVRDHGLTRDVAKGRGDGLADHEPIGLDPDAQSGCRPH